MFVLPYFKLVSAVEEIVEFAAIDFIEGNQDVEALELGLNRMQVYVIEVVEYFLGSQVVEAGDALVDVALHGEGFARAGLAIGETGDLGSLEGAIDQGTDRLPVYLLIGGLFVEGVVKVESGLLDVFGKVDFLPSIRKNRTCIRSPLSTTCYQF